MRSAPGALAIVAIVWTCASTAAGGVDAEAAALGCAGSSGRVPRALPGAGGGEAAGSGSDAISSDVAARGLDASRSARANGASAAARLSISGYRSSGRLRKHRETTCSSPAGIFDAGAAPTTLGGSAVRMFALSSASVAPPKGATPVTSS